MTTPTERKALIESLRDGQRFQSMSERNDCADMLETDAQQVAEHRAMFDEALADPGVVWPGEVDMLHAKMFGGAQQVAVPQKPTAYIHKDQLAFLRTMHGDESAQARYANGFTSWLPDSVKAEFIPLYAAPQPSQGEAK